MIINARETEEILSEPSTSLFCIFPNQIELSGHVLKQWNSYNSTMEGSRSDWSISIRADPGIIDRLMAGIFEYFVVCGLGPEIRTLDGNKGFHGTGVFYLASLLDQYPPSNHSLYAPPPPQLSTVSSTIKLLFFISPSNGVYFKWDFGCLYIYLYA